ncbi:RNA polymerase I-specific transcription-initiation factor-domain-containing protein [Dipodascopsis tothii]|uniref:RNA polymerase I-specific transcription-initiation factor-domain-containing protein n=1 Tax=Dipodascopsis tothii TaxID=44089 RepID=UPI0034CD3A32
MWPSSGSAGVCLEYGHGGSTLYAPEYASATWISPRLHGHGSQFVPANFERTLVAGRPRPAPAPAAPVGERYRSVLETLVPEHHVSFGVLSDLWTESRRQALDPAGAVDPLVGSQLAAAYARDHVGRRLRPCAVFVGGATGQDLHIAELATERHRLDDAGAWAATPTLGARRSTVAVDGRIQGVVAAGDGDGDAEPLLAVRTARDCQLFRLECDRARPAAAFAASHRLHAIANGDVAGLPLTDAAFNPWYRRQVAAVDLDGNWAVWDVEYARRWTARRQHTHAAASADENSFGNRVLWGADLNTIVVSNGLAVTAADLRAPAATVRLYESADRAQIRGVARGPAGDGYVLTSTAVRWLDWRMPARDLLAWRHFRADDPTLAMAPFECGDTAHVLVHSRQDPLLTVFQFGRDAGLPVSPDDPYILDYQRGPLAHTVVPLAGAARDAHGASVLTLLRYTADGGVAETLFSTLRVPAAAAVEPAPAEPAPAPAPAPAHACVDFSSLYAAVFADDDPELATEYADGAARAYCDALAAAVRASRFRTPRARLPLAAAARTIHTRNFADLAEFSVELERALLDLGDAGFGVHISDYESVLYVGVAALDTDAVYHSLVARWLAPLPATLSRARLRRERLCRRLALDISLDAVALSRTAAPPRPPPADFAFPVLGEYAEFAKPSRKRTLGGLQRLFADWTVGAAVADYEWAPLDADEPAPAREARSRSREHEPAPAVAPAVLQPQAPVIRSSQPAPLSPRFGASQRAFSQPDAASSQPEFAVMSQVERGAFGSRQKPKKRKRREGFRTADDMHAVITTGLESSRTAPERSSQVFSSAGPAESRRTLAGMRKPLTPADDAAFHHAYAMQLRATHAPPLQLLRRQLRPTTHLGRAVGADHGLGLDGRDNRPEVRPSNGTLVLAAGRGPGDARGRGRSGELGGAAGETGAARLALLP